MVSTGIEDLDHILEDRGYPDRSAILLISPPGAGNAPLAYLFLKYGFKCDDTVMCLTSKPITDLLNDMAVFGVNKQSPAQYIQCYADTSPYSLNNLTNLFINIKKQIDILGADHKRIYIDFLSALYMLHPAKTVYTFICGLIQSLKDGAIEIKIFEERFNIIPLMRVKKMMSQTPSYNYYRLAVSKGEIHFHDFNT